MSTTAQERFNSLLKAGRARMQDEVTALLGKPFKLLEPTFQVIGKTALLDPAAGKLVLAQVQVDGELQGNGCMIVSIGDAIAIGGMLIMLPESELNNVQAEEAYSPELQDSFGEVANIICGAATLTFEQEYAKSVRLIRKEQVVVQPGDGTDDPEQPIADLPYYCMTTVMQLDGKELGALRFVLPAELFGLIETPSAAPGAKDGATAATLARGDVRTEPEAEVLKRPQDQAVETEPVGVVERPQEAQAAEPVAETAESTTPTTAPDLSKQQHLIDTVLAQAENRVCEEVSALLGGNFKIRTLANQLVTKASFLQQVGGKQIMTRMDIRGDAEGGAFFFVEVKAAVYLGGVLIMLPEGELEDTVRNEQFGDDSRDAYGEVTNIIAGVYTAVFEEKSPVKLGFVKTAIEPITPIKIDPEADDHFPCGHYYLAMGEMEYNGRELGRLQLLIPAAALGLEGLDEIDAASMAAGGQASATAQAGSGAAKGSTTPVAANRLQNTMDGAADIALFTDDDEAAGSIAQVLGSMGHVCRVLHFKEPVNSVLTPQTKLALLVMREASELGFGVAIKISSAGMPVPLVAGAPAWTRTLVLKAVRYGACDILITPASAEDIQEVVQRNLLQKAA